MDSPAGSPIDSPSRRTLSVRLPTTESAKQSGGVLHAPANKRDLDSARSSQKAARNDAFKRKNESPYQEEIRVDVRGVADVAEPRRESAEQDAPGMENETESPAGDLNQGNQDYVLTVLLSLGHINVA